MCGGSVQVLGSPGTSSMAVPLESDGSLIAIGYSPWFVFAIIELLLCIAFSALLVFRFVFMSPSTVLGMDYGMVMYCAAGLSLTSYKQCLCKVTWQQQQVSCETTSEMVQQLFDPARLLKPAGPTVC